MREMCDDVYGSVAIPDGLLTELANSHAVQRLREVTQAGASSLVREGRNVTRYEHSLGVMGLVGLLGGSEAEQAAGLLHDLSHTAFSHTADYVFGDRKEGFHERIFHAVIENSDVPDILARHGIVWHNLFTLENQRRVDAPSPWLCADRIDYTLRDLVRFGYITRTDAQAFVAELDFQDGTLVVMDEAHAWAFVQWYAYLVGEIFMNPLELYAHDELARIIRTALRCGVLAEDDLLGTDDVVVGKLMSDGTHGLADALRRLQDTRHLTFDHANDRRAYSKARVVDPPVLRNNEVVPLSSIRPEVTLLSEGIRRKAREGVLLGRRV